MTPDAKAALDALNGMYTAANNARAVPEKLGLWYDVIRQAITQMIESGWKPMQFPAPERFDRVCGRYDDNGEWYQDMAIDEDYIKICSFTHEFILPTPPTGEQS